LYVITPQLAAQRPRDVRAFVRAYRRGAAWVNANAGKDALFALIGGYSQMNMDILRKVKMPPANADIIPSSLPRVTALMTYTGIPTGGVDLRTKVFS
jgi:ABC-type nitrate/sulfonate/bicarbonate transport system substrate-binding protein